MPGWLPLTAKVLAALFTACVLTTWLQILVVGVITPPWTITMLERGAQEGAWPHRRVRSLERLGEVGPRAVVASEDARFFLHQGFDTASMCEAIRDRIRRGKRLRGASTITQQVAKNVFLWSGRTARRKLVEAWYAFWLERLLSKERILELYLNVAETGPNTFGLEAGARHHFGKPAAKLDRSEAGRLAGILPNPRWSVSGKAAWSRATWIAQHPAPFPGDPYFEKTVERFRASPHGLLSCW